MESQTVVRSVPPAPRTDRLLMVVRRGGVVLARWALPAHASMGSAPSAPMALPVGLGRVRELEIRLLPDECTVQVRVTPSPGPGRPPSAPDTRVLDLGEPAPVGRCTVTFFPCARDAGTSAFDRAAPTLALGPVAEDVEQDLVETRLMPWRRGGAGRGDLSRVGQRAALALCTSIVRAVAFLARLGGGWLLRRCGAVLREEGEVLEKTWLSETGERGIS